MPLSKRQNAKATKPDRSVPGPPLPPAKATPKEKKLTRIKSKPFEIQYRGCVIVLALMLVSFAYLESIGVYLLVVVGGLFLIVEQLFPDQKLPPRDYWYGRALLVNCSQLVLTQIGSLTWEKSAQRWTMFELGSAPWATPLVGGLICYLAVTFVFYWWHRIRHESEFLWVSMHQLHHSAARIETLTSFYKSPYEIVADSLVIALLHYTVLGLGEPHMMYTAAFSVYGEFFYHMNIRTPHWVGYVFQRPESHRIHHARDSQFLSKNYSDLPLWDMIFGTFENPPNKLQWDAFDIGFPNDDECSVGAMLCLKNVRKPGVPWSRFGFYSYKGLGKNYSAPLLKRQDSEEISPPSYFVEQHIMFWAWFILSISYLASGLDKLSCASWQDGSALRHVLTNPLARDNAFRLWLVSTPPWVLQGMTWGSLALELGFAPAVLLDTPRKLVSLLIIGMHLGILLVINFTDLSFGVLMLHFFTVPSLLHGSRWDFTQGRYTTWQFNLFLSVLGTYLFIHFMQLVPYAPALWSNKGMIPDPALLPTKAFPNILIVLSEPAHVQGVVLFAAFLSALLAFQFKHIRPAVAFTLWYIWACLWNRNVFISNPGLPFVGWTLLACALWQEQEESEVPKHQRKWWRAPQWLRVTGANALGVIGVVQVMAYYLGSPQIRALSMATVASPLPLVFSAYNGHETFSGSFRYSAQDVHGVWHKGTVGPALYSRVNGAYNYRNTFGVMLSHGPFFTKPDQLELRRRVLEYGFCSPGYITASSGLSGNAPLRALNVTVTANAAGEEGQEWTVPVECTPVPGFTFSGVY